VRIPGKPDILSQIAAPKRPNPVIPKSTVSDED
jgi:hypothetical protein